MQVRNELGESFSILLRGHPVDFTAVKGRYGYRCLMFSC